MMHIFLLLQLCPFEALLAELRRKSQVVQGKCGLQIFRYNPTNRRIDLKVGNNLACDRQYDYSSNPFYACVEFLLYLHRTLNTHRARYELKEAWHLQQYLHT
jgi:hypothetical protein